MDKPRLLNGCARSRFIADAFEAMGWEAWTCDILPPEGPGNHIQDDVLKHLNDGWDMAIFHPECTYLAYSGVRWLHERPGRWDLVREAAGFFNLCLDAPIARIAVENPVQHRYARDLIRKYDQIVQPWMFGDGYVKATCLWLVNLPPLMATVISSGRVAAVHHEWPGPERKANRSRTYPGIATAMASQWGCTP